MDELKVYTYKTVSLIEKGYKIKVTLNIEGCNYYAYIENEVGHIISQWSGSGNYSPSIINHKFLKDELKKFLRERS